MYFVIEQQSWEMWENPKTIVHRFADMKELKEFMDNKVMDYFMRNGSHFTIIRGTELSHFFDTKVRFKTCTIWATPNDADSDKALESTESTN